MDEYEANGEGMDQLSDHEESDFDDNPGAGLGGDSMHPVLSFAQESDLAIEEANDVTIDEIGLLTATEHRHGMFMPQKVSGNSHS